MHKQTTGTHKDQKSIELDIDALAAHNTATKKASHLKYGSMIG